MLAGLGCAPLPEKKLPHVHNNKKKKKKERNRNCTELIWQDLEYREAMRFDAATLERLVSGRFPQRLDGADCAEDGATLARVIRDGSAATGQVIDESAWVLPREEARDNATAVHTSHNDTDNQGSRSL